MNEYQDQAQQVDIDWAGNEAHFQLAYKGFTSLGTLRVQPSQVEIEAKLPLIARPFHGKIERFLRDKIGEILQP